ncbi:MULTISPECIES: flagellar biosynthesis anti-sigma factor FlgM [Dethiosulfovibrio]|jgi:negative regulator of flagellin synthesis FlgM|uniref:Flagellar biosynthesis anti-sigma factor FlgM n=2 Tax=Dethiosulfovibrio TaxID=47054 RepID=A0ABS9ENQ6_9BACT|nr:MULTISPECIES: flagellar biosynthesis anti-sigma factor FlgM [Dethiosulfovibrio]MCF4113051.1 flagellar biosynthesis anti-sigma factor FlgM [Dethiosulfovibrio russensis]MCF4141515.1 flagellar biosynthesis anti-sigma factor FlgM [Dethiosulfovibrio marinus]MCF4144471.1 flagellar biosynthesis anti-sigma factor FlgM [Dethiosulfovibrio acidaminovorans]MEA3285533.1 flagellar biosynthesis anti-sigma factor FlgM [Synergistota bacterium]
MIDKIVGSYLYNGGSPVKNRKKIDSNVGTDKKIDGVEVSDFAQTLGKAMMESRKVSDVRQDKVQAMSESIDSGSYDPDMGILAAKLIAAGLTRSSD